MSPDHELWSEVTRLVVLRHWSIEITKNSYGQVIYALSADIVMHRDLAYQTPDLTLLHRLLINPDLRAWR